MNYYFLIFAGDIIISINSEVSLVALEIRRIKCIFIIFRIESTTHNTRRAKLRIIL